jgi:hypothetical protein
MTANKLNQHRRGESVFGFWWALGLVLALVPLRSLAADGPPTPTDVEQLIAHLRTIPPQTYDIEVIAEFVLPKNTEKAIREAVSDVFSRTGGASALNAPPGTSPELEQEIQRLLAEQEVPRRMRKRCISSRELGYRLEQVVEHNGPFYAPNETGPAETAAISEININVGNKPGDSRSVYLSPIETLAGLHASGRRVLEEDVWAGGTLGPLMAGLLRSSLAIDAPEEPEQIDLFVKGRHPIIGAMTVDRDQALPDGNRGRRFTFSIKDSTGKKGTTAFDVPTDSFDPVWLVSVGGKKYLKSQRPRMALPGNGLSTTAKTPPTESYATRRSPAPSTNPLIRRFLIFVHRRDGTASITPSIRQNSCTPTARSSLASRCALQKPPQRHAPAPRIGTGF